MGKAGLGEVTASQVGRAHGGGCAAYVSCRECASCIAKCARSMPGKMMRAKTVMCKAASGMKAASGDTQSSTT